MPYRAHFVPVPGSDKNPIAGAQCGAASSPDQTIEVTVMLRRQAHPNADDVNSVLGTSFNDRRYFTREQYHTKFGASAADIAKIEEFAHEFGLAVAEIHPGSRMMRLSGPVSAFSKAFDVELSDCQHPDGKVYRGRTGSVNVPAELEGIVVGVFGLDDRPVARPHLRHRPGALDVSPHKSGPKAFTAQEVAILYNFPEQYDGTGQTIGIIELGGGYKTADLNAYFKLLNLKTPSVTAVSVGGATNKPTGNPNGNDGEVVLDIEVAGAVAPGAKIVVYFAHNTDQGFVNAISAAVHDKQHNPSILSISWGAPEAGYTKQSLNAYNAALEDAATLGVTVCIAAGDDGSTDGVKDGHLHVDFPGSSPFSLTCGGTTLKLGAGNKPEETVWNDLSSGNGAGGGGVSDFFPVPSYQSKLKLPKNTEGKPGRCVPDVAGDADPVTGYLVRVDGQSSVVGGTSAVAPLWAGLLARVNQALGKPVGFIHPAIYAAAPTGFHDITTGSNGATGTYAAAKGYDCATGLGTPDGAAILGVLGGKGKHAPPPPAKAKSVKAGK